MLWFPNPCVSTPRVFQQSQNQSRLHHMARCIQHMVSVTTRLQPTFWRSSVHIYSKAKLDAYAGWKVWKSCRFYTSFACGHVEPVSMNLQMLGCVCWYVCSCDHAYVCKRKWVKGEIWCFYQDFIIFQSRNMCPLISYHKSNRKPIFMFPLTVQKNPPFC